MQPLQVAPCFWLAPFGNRVRDGQVDRAGMRHSLSRNTSGTIHPLHGYAWQGTWRCVSQPEREEAELAYYGRRNPWPSQYRVQQHVRLDELGLAVAVAVTLTLANLDEVAMPAGLGLHPGFPTRRLLGVRAPVKATYANSEDLIPRQRLADSGLARCLATGQGVPEDYDCDGWNGDAWLYWQDRELVLRADKALNCLHVFAPAAIPVLCVEPVSHLTNAAGALPPQWPEGPAHILPPGGTWTTSIRLDLHAE